MIKLPHTVTLRSLHSGRLAHLTVEDRVIDPQRPDYTERYIVIRDEGAGEIHIPAKGGFGAIADHKDHSIPGASASKALVFASHGGPAYIAEGDADLAEIIKDIKSAVDHK